MGPFYCQTSAAYSNASGELQRRASLWSLVVLDSLHVFPWMDALQIRTHTCFSIDPSVSPHFHEFRGTSGFMPASFRDLRTDGRLPGLRFPLGQRRTLGSTRGHAAVSTATP